MIEEINKKRSTRRNHLAQERNENLRLHQSKKDKVKKVLLEYGVKEQDLPVLIRILENILNVTID